MIGAPLLLNALWGLAGMVVAVPLLAARALGDCLIVGPSKEPVKHVGPWDVEWQGKIEQQTADGKTVAVKKPD